MTSAGILCRRGKLERVRLDELAIRVNPDVPRSIKVVSCRPA